MTLKILPVAHDEIRIIITDDGLQLFKNGSEQIVSETNFIFTFIRDTHERERHDVSIEILDTRTKSVHS